MYPSPILHILVAGSGTDALVTAATLKRSFPGINLTLLRDPSATPADPAGESTTPAVLQHLCNAIGLAGPDIHLHARPIWNLGFRCQWGARGTFFRSFDSPYANPLQGFRTEPGYLADASNLDNASLASSLMAAGKLFPKDGANAFKPIENVTGLNLRPQPLHDLLLRACTAIGINIQDGKVIGLNREPDTLVLEDGRILQADLYVDATGTDAVLSNLAGNTQWKSFADACLCTRAATIVRRRGSEPIRPFVTLETLETGWRWRVDHDDSIGLGHSWHPDFISEDEACAALVTKGGDSSLVPRVHQWDSGRREQAWVGSVVAIGDASGFIDPMSSFRATHLIQQINWLIRCLVATDGMPGNETRGIYSRVVADALEETRDFHAIHYRFNAAGKSPFWDTARATAKVDRHAGLVDLYQSIGPSTVLAHSIQAWPGFVGIDSWLAALIGMGLSFRHRKEIPAQEKRAWDSQCEQRRALAKQAVAPELCIGAARRAVRPEPRVRLP